MDFVVFLEEHPELYEVSKSEVLVRLLSILEKRALSFLSLKKETGMEPEDLEAALEALERAGAVERISYRKNIIYAITEKGRRFLELYRREKRKFSLK